MRVLLAGSSGLIGSATAERLRGSGHEVRRLVRRAPSAADEFGWDPPSGRVDPGALHGVDAVVNFCGAPLLPKRWSAARKQIITDSRLEPTEVLADAAGRAGVSVLVNASAVGYYGDGAARELDESTPNGTGFLARLCRDWEAMAETATKAGVRVVRVRTGLVLSSTGGLLAALKPLFRLALGARLGSGTQYLPWITLEDVTSAVRFVLEDTAMSGAVNLTAPRPVTNTSFTRTLSGHLHRPAPWWMPAPALRALLGEAADEMVLVSQRAVPRALTGAGYEFRHEDLDSALVGVL